ncbi:MAG: DUF87 domain-containing protein [bacterium]
MNQKQEKNTDKNKSFNKLSAGMLNVKDIIAPSAIEIDFNFIKIGEKFFRTLFVSGYPRFVGANWLAPIINYEHSLEVSMFYYPVEARGVLDDLRRKIAEMEATLNADTERGRIVDPGVKAALEDAKSLQEQLVKGIERFFQFSFYITIPADSLEELNSVTRKVEATLGSLMLISKMCTLQMEEAFQSTIPTCTDKLLITRNMDTTSVATTFPFTSSELTSNEGILYGINKHNGSLVIFDRFTLENANSVIFAKSGAGKSYFVKLEALRSILFGADIIVIDPEAEYERLSKTLGGDYISFSVGSPSKINPFDLPPYSGEDEENQLGLKILSLHTLFKIMLGSSTDNEEAILDRALMMTYKIKGITQDPQTHKNEPPILEDLYKVLLGMEEPSAKSISERLERYIKGSLMGVFDQRSTVNITNSFTAFSVRELEDVLRPIAIYIILDFIWTRIKYELKKRILIVDEAWYLMQNEDSANFLYSIAKRARKYYLALTTITHDVDDFLSSEYGKTIVTNSSMQILLKQHPASIDKLAEVFYLSEGEKRFLLSAGVGEGLFFAGNNHVAIQIMASEEENRIVTTNPKEVVEIQKEEKIISDKIKEIPQKPSLITPPPPTPQPTVSHPPTVHPTPTIKPVEVKRDFPKPENTETKPNETPKIFPKVGETKPLQTPVPPNPPTVSSIQ